MVIKVLAFLSLFSSTLYAQQANPAVKQAPYPPSASGATVPTPTTSNQVCFDTDGVNTYRVPCPGVQVTAQGSTPVTVNGDNASHTGSSFTIACPTCNSSTSTPVFKQYANVAGTNSGALSSVTSGAITTATGDLLVAYCRSASSRTAEVITDSRSGTWNALTKTTNTNTAQMSWQVVASGGSTTFTCTPSSSDTFIALVVLDYSSTGSTKNGNSASSGSNAFATTFSTAFNTSQKTLNITCANFNAGSQVFTPSVIGGTQGILRGQDVGSLGSNATIGCADSTTTTAITGMNGGLLYGTPGSSSSAAWIADTLSINY